MGIRFILPILEEPECEGPPARYVWRHDWQTWIAQYVNANGDQIGDAAYGYRKRDAIANLGSLAYHIRREDMRA